MSLTELAALYEVSSYPTIILYGSPPVFVILSHFVLLSRRSIRNGQWREYRGHRESEYFYEYALLGGYEKMTPKKAPRASDEIVAPPTPTTSDVVVLGSNNFSQAISQGRWLVELYVTPCMCESTLTFLPLVTKLCAMVWALQEPRPRMGEVGYCGQD